jgi:hypothetical protein
MNDHSSNSTVPLDYNGGLPAGEVVEIPLLLPDWQVCALEAAARRRGLTAGEMVRSLVREFLSRLPAPCPADRVVSAAHRAFSP